MQCIWSSNSVSLKEHEGQSCCWRLLKVVDSLLTVVKECGDERNVGINGDEKCCQQLDKQIERWEVRGDGRVDVLEVRVWSSRIRLRIWQTLYFGPSSACQLFCLFLHFRKTPKQNNAYVILPPSSALVIQISPKRVTLFFECETSWELITKSYTNNLTEM